MCTRRISYAALCISNPCRCAKLRHLHAYAIAGNPNPTVSKTSGDNAITWNTVGNKLNIAAGLESNSYPVVLTAISGAKPDATITFTLTVGNLGELDEIERRALEVTKAIQEALNADMAQQESRTNLIKSGKLKDEFIIGLTCHSC